MGVLYKFQGKIVMARGYKTFFMLNAFDHEIYLAKLYQNITNLTFSLLNRSENEIYLSNRY